MKILLLAGTAEARALAEQLHSARIDVIASLAGMTQRPARLAGEMRVGGFGGIDGLKAYLARENITHIIDATHPFAAQMSRHAEAAARGAKLPLLQLMRPPWPEATHWTMVPDLDAAAAALTSGARVFLSTGRASLTHFEPRDDVEFLARVIDDLPDDFPLARGRFVVGKPPFAVEEEMALMRDEAVDVVVSRNSGGTGGVEKLIAAQRLGLEVVMVARPALLDVPRVQTVDEAVAWVAAQDTDQ